MIYALPFVGWFTGGRLLITAGTVLALAWLRVLWGYGHGHVTAPPRWYMARSPGPDDCDLQVLNREYCPLTGGAREGGAWPTPPQKSGSRPGGAGQGEAPGPEPRLSPCPLDEKRAE
jgi:hypothetical protein